MDLKVVNGAVGAAQYCCYYINKAEPQELRDAVSKLVNEVLEIIQIWVRKQNEYRRLYAEN